MTSEFGTQDSPPAPPAPPTATSLKSVADASACPAFVVAAASPSASPAPPPPAFPVRHFLATPAATGLAATGYAPGQGAVPLEGGLTQHSEAWAFGQVAVATTEQCAGDVRQEVMTGAGRILGEPVDATRTPADTSLAAFPADRSAAPNADTDSFLNTPGATTASNAVGAGPQATPTPTPKKTYPSREHRRVREWPKEKREVYKNLMSDGGHLTDMYEATIAVCGQQRNPIDVARDQVKSVMGALEATVNSYLSRPNAAPATLEELRDWYVVKMLDHIKYRKRMIIEGKWPTPKRKKHDNGDSAEGDHRSEDDDGTIKADVAGLCSEGSTPVPSVCLPEHSVSSVAGADSVEVLPEDIGTSMSLFSFASEARLTPTSQSSSAVPPDDHNPLKQDLHANSRYDRMSSISTIDSSASYSSNPFISAAASASRATSVAVSSHGAHRTFSLDPTDHSQHDLHGHYSDIGGVGTKVTFYNTPPHRHSQSAVPMLHHSISAGVVPPTIHSSSAHGISLGVMQPDPRGAEDLKRVSVAAPNEMTSVSPTMLRSADAGNDNSGIALQVTGPPPDSSPGYLIIRQDDGQIVRVLADASGFLADKKLKAT